MAPSQQGVPLWMDSEDVAGASHTEKSKWPVTSPTMMAVNKMASYVITAARVRAAHGCAPAQPTQQHGPVRVDHVDAVKGGEDHKAVALALQGRHSPLARPRQGLTGKSHHKGRDDTERVFPRRVQLGAREEEQHSRARVGGHREPHEHYAAHAGAKRSGSNHRQRHATKQPLYVQQREHPGQIAPSSRKSVHYCKQ